MTPLLLPVVPDVKIIVAVSSGAGLSASLSEVLTIFFKSETKETVLLLLMELLAKADILFNILFFSVSLLSLLSIHIFFNFGQSARIEESRERFLGLKKSASESERLIRSVRSLSGSPASRGTATHPPVIIPR